MRQKSTKRILIMNPVTNPCLPCRYVKRKNPTNEDYWGKYRTPFENFLIEEIKKCAKNNNMKSIIILQTLLELFGDGAITSTDAEKHIRKYAVLKSCQ